jgi:hypothetical protein
MRLVEENVMNLSSEELRELARYVLITRPNEIGCDDWLTYAPRYAELIASRQNIPETLRQLAQHLDACPECAEEFRACLAALAEGRIG